MRLDDLVGLLPLAVAVALAVAAVGRDAPHEIARATVHRLGTIAIVLVGVALVLRLLIALFV